MENKFVVEQKPFFSLLSAVQPICTKRTTIDSTSCVLVSVGHKELVLKSTDLEISLQATYVAKESSVDSPTSFLVSGKRLFDLVKELEGDIMFSLSDTQLKLSSGKVRLNLNIKDPQEFPPFPERIENLMHFDRAFLLEMINKVAFLIPQNNANPALNGLLLELSPEELKMTATDGHCLAQVHSTEYKLEEAKSWLLPRRAVFEIKKLLENAEDQEVFMGVCGNQLVISGVAFNFFTKLLSDSFPEYRAILDKQSFVPARIDRSHLIKTLRRSSCLLSGQFIATNFTFADSGLSVSMQNKEVGNLEEQVPLLDYENKDVDVRFYAPYLLSGLQVFSGDYVQFYLKDTSKPIIFELSGSKYELLYLVMPVAPIQDGQ